MTLRNNLSHRSTCKCFLQFHHQLNCDEFFLRGNSSYANKMQSLKFDRCYSNEQSSLMSKCVKQIRSVNLSFNEIGDEGVAVLMNSLQNIKDDLALERCGISHNGIRILAEKLIESGKEARNFRILLFLVFLWHRFQNNQHFYRKAVSFLLTSTKWRIHIAKFPQTLTLK